MKARTRCKLTTLSTLLSCQSAILDIEETLRTPQKRRVRITPKTKGRLREIEKQAVRLFSQGRAFQA